MLRSPVGKLVLLVLGICVLLSACSVSGSTVTDGPGEEETPSAGAETPEEAAPLGLVDGPVGYFDCAYVGDGFLAAGSGGRLDHIGVDGEVTPVEVPTEQDLLCLYTESGAPLIVGGENGALLYSGDGQTFTQAEGISGRIYAITSFQGAYYAASEGGLLLRSTDGDRWDEVVLEADVTGDIISVDANDRLIMAVTAETDVLLSEDGVNWQWQNFNENYQQFYEPYVFAGLQNMGSSFFIYGHLEEDPGVPFAMFSEMADVWMFKPLSEINGQEPSVFLPLAINAMDLCGDQLVAACSGGRLLTITECSVCNQISSFGEQDLYTLATGGGMLLAAGQAFSYELMDETGVRQDQIAAEQAYMDMLSGAVIVDVRTDEEYAEGHIAGCFHIPVDRVEEQLPQLIPDTETEIIFYCAAGGRSQTALETALELGYPNVYNLGAFDSWPYETEAGPG